MESGRTVLIIPGLGDSGPQHWQTLWEAESVISSEAFLSHYFASIRGCFSSASICSLSRHSEAKGD
jgi:predicted alpha/beta hydrolase family esterase